MRGEDIALQAMKKEHARLRKIADKAKAEVDAYCNVGSELLAIHEELREIVALKEYGQHILDRLEALKKRDTAARKLMNADFMDISNKQFEAESNAQALAGEISVLEMRRSIRAGKFA